MFCSITQISQADDVVGLNKVIGLVQSSSSTLADGNEEKLLDSLAKLNLDDDSSGGKKHPSWNNEKYKPTEVARITKLCASFTRATTLLTDLDRYNGARFCAVSGLLVV
jgi:hypothetical protein